MEIKSSIYGISGSPRLFGNTDFAVKYMLDKIHRQTKLPAEFIRISDHNIRPCLGCRICMTNDDCAITNDEFYPIWEKLVSSKFFVMGAPVFWLGPPGQLKDFIDRTHAWYACPQKVHHGVKMALISVAGDEGFESHESVMTCWAEYYNIEIIGKARLIARERGDLENSPSQLAKLDNLVSRVLKLL